MSQNTPKLTRSKLQKIVAIILIVLIFVGAIWLIIKPFLKPKEDLSKKGINMDIPSASVDSLPSDKITAYQEAWRMEDEQKKEEEMARLDDFFASRQDEESLSETPSKEESLLDSYLSSYQGATQSMDSYLNYDPEKEYLREQLEELNAKLTAKEQASSLEAEYAKIDEAEETMTDRVMAMYAKAQEKPIAPDSNRPPNDTKLPTFQLLTEERQVVSRLSDGTILSSNNENGDEVNSRNLEFFSPATTKTTVDRNTLKVVVDRTTTLQNRSFVTLRLTESAIVGDLRLSKNSRMVAEARISGNRMRLLVSSVEAQGRIIATGLSAFDTDGQEGVYVPEIESLTALKDAGNTLIGSGGSGNYSINRNSTDMIVGELTQAGIQTAKQLLQRKLQEVKVTLKGGYRLFLVSTERNK